QSPRSTSSALPSTPCSSRATRWPNGRAPHGSSIPTTRSWRRWPSSSSRSRTAPSRCRPTGAVSEAPLAIIAGRGPLPRLVAENCRKRGRPYRVVVFEGEPVDWTDGHPVIHASFEKPGRMFAALREAGCKVATFAGGMQRPKLNPLRFDLKMMRLAPQLVAGLKGGDDATLRTIGAIFEAEGLELQAAQDLAEEVLVPEGVLTRAAPSEADRRDTERAAAIVAAMGTVDVGQGAVVAQGLCLGVESIQ